MKKNETSENWVRVAKHKMHGKYANVHTPLSLGAWMQYDDYSTGPSIA